MKLMIIQEFQIALRYFKDLTTQTPNDCVRCQEEVALDTILIRSKSDPKHGYLHRNIRRNAGSVKDFRSGYTRPIATCPSSLGLAKNAPKRL